MHDHVPVHYFYRKLLYVLVLFYRRLRLGDNLNDSESRCYRDAGAGLRLPGPFPAELGMRLGMRHLTARRARPDSGGPGQRRGRRRARPGPAATVARGHATPWARTRRWDRPARGDRKLSLAPAGGP